MCGLVGVFGNKLTNDHEMMFLDMLDLDEIRGEDSTGVTLVKENIQGKYETNILKSVGRPKVWRKKHKAHVDGAGFKDFRIKCLMGHNRWATQGKVDLAGAHPFEYHNLIGMHNGTVAQHSLKEFEGYNDYDIDSQIIFKELDTNYDVQWIWDNGDGAMTLTWWDKYDNTLHFVTNGQRPLHFTMVNGALVWSSESWIIAAAIFKNGVKGDIGKLESVPLDTHIKFSIEDGEVVREDTKLDPYTEKRHNYSGAWWNQQGNYYSQLKAEDDFYIPFYIEDVLTYEEGGKERVRFFGKDYFDGMDIVINLYSPEVPAAKRFIEDVLDKGRDFVWRAKKGNFFDAQGTQDYATLPYMFVVPFGRICDLKFAVGHNLKGEEVILNFEEYIEQMSYKCSFCYEDFQWWRPETITWIAPDMPSCQDCEEKWELERSKKIVCLEDKRNEKEKSKKKDETDTALEYSEKSETRPEKDGEIVDA